MSGFGRSEVFWKVTGLRARVRWNDRSFQIGLETRPSYESRTNSASRALYVGSQVGTPLLRALLRHAPPPRSLIFEKLTGVGKGSHAPYKRARSSPFSLSLSLSLSLVPPFSFALSFPLCVCAQNVARKREQWACCLSRLGRFRARVVGPVFYLWSIVPITLYVLERRGRAGRNAKPFLVVRVDWIAPAPFPESAGAPHSWGATPLIRSRL